MMKYIVLVNGFSNSGKDTFSDFLVKTGNNFVKYAFADELKHYTSDKYNFDYKLTLTQEGKNTYINNCSVRELLIYEAKKVTKQNPDFYAMKLTKKIKFTDKIHNYRCEINKSIVISDWRFPNEYNCIANEFKNYKIITVRINRTKVSPVNSKTENYLNDFKFDYTIDNTSTLSEFYKNIINKLYFLFD